MEKIQLWTDGSCNNNSKHSSFGYGGWGFVVVRDKKVIFEDLGFQEKATSNTMEMTAVIKGLKHLIKNHEGSKIEVYSDSAYVVNCFLERWYIRWREMEWDDVKNKELWIQLLELYESKLVRVRFVKVKGHAGIKYNERADFLAGEARNYLLYKNSLL